MRTHDSHIRRLILYDEDSFRLIKSQNNPTIHFITHQCPMTRTTIAPNHAIVSGSDWVCKQCGATPPDEMKMLYELIDGEPQFSMSTEWYCGPFS
jgi:hypothetical protein